IQAAEFIYSPLIGKYQASGDLPKVVDIYQKLADACNRINHPESGIEYYQYIQDIVERIGTPAEKARLYNNMGYQYFLTHDYKAAIT
ncbi:hypothetical protein, partial [Pseudomonas alvandae]|uniref:hypothetical protein n=1 Tax=Pseudomonas canavaninivorans TaxID=2842348 RepID=UPI002B1DAD5E